jgi:restriction system protein
MPIPDFQTVMLPLLRLTQDQQEHSKRQVTERLAATFRLTDAERQQLLPSGRQPTFDNRVGWAVTYLRKAGLLDTTRRGYFRITRRGLDLLNEDPERINLKLLERYPEYIEFRTRTAKVEGGDDGGAMTDTTGVETQTPEEAIEAAHQQLRDALASDLLQQIMACTPGFFERLVVDLLVRMGYGGTRKDAGQAIGKSGDGGIDGIIKEDRLGLDVIYIQAKRWEGTVGRPEIQKFVGALQGQRAKRGIFITTTSFSQDAVRYAAMIENKVVLIDGNVLAQLMIDTNVGVSPISSYEVKRVDTDYFNEE